MKYKIIKSDTYTGWLKIIEMRLNTSSRAISVLQEGFFNPGNLKVVLSDSGPELTADKFNQFYIKFGMTHIRSTLYHPKTNGLAELIVTPF